MIRHFSLLLLLAGPFLAGAFFIAMPALADDVSDGVSGPASAGTEELYARAIQEELGAQGFYAGAIDGKVGPLTSAAIKAWQKAAGSPTDGIAGPALLNALRFGPKQNAPRAVKAAEPRVELQAGDAPYIRHAQTALASLGFYQGAIDGIAGPATAAAVSRFQTERGLAIDGRVTPALFDLIGSAPAATPVSRDPATAPATAPAPQASDVPAAPDVPAVPAAPDVPAAPMTDSAAPTQGDATAPQVPEPPTPGADAGETAGEAMPGTATVDEGFTDKPTVDGAASGPSAAAAPSATVAPSAQSKSLTLGGS